MVVSDKANVTNFIHHSRPALYFSAPSMRLECVSLSGGDVVDVGVNGINVPVSVIVVIYVNVSVVDVANESR